MDTNFDNLKRLIDKLKIIGFWRRLFNWNTIKQELVDAAIDLQKIIDNIDRLKEQKADQASEISEIVKDLQTANDAINREKGETNKISIENKGLSESNRSLRDENKRLSNEAATNAKIIERKNELDSELTGIKIQYEIIKNELGNVKQQNGILLSEEDTKRKKHDNDIAVLNSIKEKIENDRNNEVDERNKAENERIRNLKETWNRHQENVKNQIKNICSKHIIEYVEKVPFKGEPDNTLKICDELIVFDAKSPASDDLTNFPTYLKSQAEAAKKYAKQENVKVDIFFVVPSNTLDRLTTFAYNLADYNVFIISVSSLEPIILGLRKIEEYEFAEQLSPEERDNICRILGKFAHLTKRRIQIDSFFAKQFVELVYKCESDLPQEIIGKISEFEKSEKLNPPVEKRAKTISTKEIEKDTNKLKTEFLSIGILIDDAQISNGLNGLQLYTEEKPLD